MTVLVLLGAANGNGLQFKIDSICDGTTVGWPKDKNVGCQVVEDGTSSSPYLIAAADGVSGAPFDCGPFANFLVNNLNHFVLSTERKARTRQWFEEEIKKQVVNEIKEYNNEVKKVISRQNVKNLINDLGYPKENSFDQFLGVSTTLTVASISQESENSYISIIQRGDSGALVFTPVTNPSAMGIFHFEPKFATKEQNYKFNMPYTFQNIAKDTGNEKITHIRAEEGYITLVFTDGFSDNISLSFTSFLTNFIILEFQEDYKFQKSIKRIISLIDRYNEKMAKSYEILQDHAEILAKPEVKSEWNSGSLKNLFTGMFSSKQSVDTIVIDNKVKIHPPSKIKTETTDPFDLFFECNIVKIVSAEQTNEKQPDLIPVCIKKSLETIFRFSLNNIKKILSNIRQKDMAYLLRLVPQLLLKNVDHNFSPFYFKKASEIKKVPKQAIGKPDDISIVVGVVVEADKNKEKEIEKMVSALQANKEIILKEMDNETCYYVFNFKVKDEEKKRSNSVGKFGII
jgi:hypothetical protein